MTAAAAPGNGCTFPADGGFPTDWRLMTAGWRRGGGGGLRLRFASPVTVRSANPPKRKRPATASRRGPRRLCDGAAGSAGERVRPDLQLEHFRLRLDAAFAVEVGAGAG